MKKKSSSQSEILNLSGITLTQAIKRNELSAKEVIHAYFKNIEDLNPQINAIIQTNQESAIQAAAHIDQNLSRYSNKKLLGVPVTVKNFCHVKGFSPDKGCKPLSGNISPFDATVVARMKHEGAIIIGLTNTPEFSIGYETDNVMYGKTLNPYDFSRTPGGSSGGESAAISAQLSLMGIGSDLSGSLRVPSHNTGMTCLKMTQGRVPFTGSFPSDNTGLFSQFISCGPMARYVEDLKNLSSVIVGPDGIDPHTHPVPWSNEEVSLNDLKVCIYDCDGISDPCTDTIRVVNSVKDSMHETFKSMTPDRPACLDKLDSMMKNNIFLGGDKGLWLENIISHINLTEPSALLQEFLELAKSSEFSMTDLRQTWMEFDEFRKEMLIFLQQYDAIICPVAATPAKKHGVSFKESRDFSYSVAYSIFSCPVAVVRCGSTSGGLPIGLQIIASPWREDIVLSIAKDIERKLGGWIAPSLDTRPVSQPNKA